jgi:hypothetical protein
LHPLTLWIAEKKPIQLNFDRLLVSDIKIYIMKIIRSFSIVFLTLVSGVYLHAQQESGVDSTGLPGDNFSLQGALQMFQKAGSTEEFEKLLNTEDNNVNNLDLNGDGEIDYVRVIDKMDKDIHALILQVVVSETENQDIAVIEIEKTGAEDAVLQIIGDQDIYGEEVIIEPDGGGDTGVIMNEYPGEVASGPYANPISNTARIIVNVWLWPSVRFIYAPVYIPWVSPWRWHYYPAWWRPWRPYAWNVFHPRCIRYHRPFVLVHTNRVIHAHIFYKPYRVGSVIVRTRHSVAVNNYRVTRSRTTITGPRGNSATRITTTVRGKNGKVKASKTTVKRRRG